MTDETNNEPLKLVDFAQKRKEKEEQSTDQKTKYDFRFDEIDYELKVDVYKNGIAILYVHEQERNMGPITMVGMCKHSEQFIELSKWEKFLNFLGANITVEDKVDKYLPYFKEESLKELEVTKELDDRRKAFQEKLK